MSNEEIQLTIKVTGGSPLSIDASNDWEVAKIKQICLERTQIPVEQQRLIYKGKILKDGDKLSALGVLTGHTMHLVKSIQSGATNPSSAPAATPTPVESVPQASARPSVPPMGGFGNAGAANPFGFPMMEPNPEMMQTFMSSLFNRNEGTNTAATGNQENALASMVSQVTNAMLQGMNNNPQGTGGTAEPAANPLLAAFSGSPYMSSMMAGSNIPAVSGQIPATQGETAAGTGAATDISPPNTTTPTAAANLNPPGGVGANFSGLGNAQQNPFLQEILGSMMNNSQSGPFRGDSVRQAMDLLMRNPQFMQSAVSTVLESLNQPGANMAPNLAGTGGQVPGMNPNLAAQIPNLNLLASQIGFGGPAADMRLPEQLYTVQLRSLQEMGFIDNGANIRALQETGGDVNAAITRLLERGFGN
ncbi:ubiquitin family protein [Cardiosporidium cionae]|uniref:Ubiquitin family protein n=1 Tax=Cardiosporidium cionae TaxID=476202 RepID=A0ABQ7JFK4_9APIC|nr:ubiquitin family protein [Cardiosporidium cionae]|eukprot:KAF8822818.1 ubiquitin family protein [Cardiosporidium cionae]